MLSLGQWLKLTKHQNQLLYIMPFLGLRERNWMRKTAIAAISTYPPSIGFPKPSAQDED